MATKSFLIGTGDGHVRYFASGFLGSWNSVHDAAAGNEATPAATTAKAGARQHSASAHEIWRGFLPLDLSSYPRGVRVQQTVGGLPIPSPKVNIYVNSKTNTDNDGQDYLTIVGETSQDDFTTLVTDDFDECGAVDNPTKLSEDIDIGALGTGAFNSWFLNSAGEVVMEAAFGVGYFAIGIREGHDQEDVSIIGGENSIVFRTRNYGAAIPSSWPTVTGSFVYPQVI